MTHAFRNLSYKRVATAKKKRRSTKEKMELTLLMNTEQAIKRLTQFADDEVLAPRVSDISRKLTVPSRKVMCHFY